MIAVAGTSGAPVEAVSCRLVTPWSGPWLADVDVTLDDTGIVPSGRVTLTIGTSAFLGTVDDRASGQFGAHAKLRIVAGAGGWDKDVAAQHFHNDAPGGVLSTVVLEATAAEVDEEVLEAVPIPLGIDYSRTAGPAGRVLRGRPWYVNPAGITVVGPRVPVPADPTSVTLVSWDPLTQRAELASDDVLAPGTILTDPTIGTATVRDVEQVFTSEGSQITAWCSSTPATRLATAFAKAAREAVGPYDRPYLYRVVVQSPADGRLSLQIVDRGSGAPDALPISVMAGVPGVSAKLTPGTVVMLSFPNGDPTRPRVHSFDDTVPIELDVEAVAKIGLTAALVEVDGALTASTLAVAGGVRPVASAGAINSALQAIGAALTTISAATVPPTSAAAVTANAAIQAALNEPPTKVLA